jgi:hypothetical protein
MNALAFSQLAQPGAVKIVTSISHLEDDGAA